MKVKVPRSYRRPSPISTDSRPLDLSQGRQASTDAYMDLLTHTSIRDLLIGRMRWGNDLRNSESFSDILKNVMSSDMPSDLGSDRASDVPTSDLPSDSVSGGSGSLEPEFKFVAVKTELDNALVDSGRCDDDDSSDVASPGGSRATYMSANCVVFTHYTGDVASVVDQHFSRALSYSQDKASPGSDKECSPMSARNFPPSFWNAGSVSVAHGHGHDVYGDSVYHGATAHTPADPWHTHYQQYTAAAHHHRAVHDYHHHHQHMAGYGGLLLPPSSRLPPHQYPKTMDWNHRLHHDQTAHHPALDPATSYASYPSMAGLEAPVQDSSKDLYFW